MAAYVAYAAPAAPTPNANHRASDRVRENGVMPPPAERQRINPAEADAPICKEPTTRTATRTRNILEGGRDFSRKDRKGPGTARWKQTCGNEMLLFRSPLLDRLQEGDERVDTGSVAPVRGALLPCEHLTPDRHGSVAVSSGSTARDDLAQTFSREHSSVASGIHREVGNRRSQLFAHRSRSASGLTMATGAIGSKQLSTVRAPSAGDLQ